MNMRNVLLTPKAFKELSEWAAEDRRVVARIIELIADIQRDPFSGIGKPEPLKREYKGLWSKANNCWTPIDLSGGR